MILDNLQFTGKLNIVKTSETGDKEFISVDNLIVSAGKTFICSRIASNSPNVMTHMAVGTGNTTAVLGDTTLQSELARVALTVSGGTPSSNTITYTGEFPAGTGTGSLTEAGIFNASSGGTMIARTSFPVINKQASDTISITWVISLA